MVDGGKLCGRSEWKSGEGNVGRNNFFINHYFIYSHELASPVNYITKT